MIKHQNRGYDAHRKAYFEYVNELEAWKTARSQITGKKPGPAQQNRDTWKQELNQLGEEPEPPISNTILIGADPTYEGLFRFFREGGGAIAAQFTSEGGAFIGGHSMSDETRLRTATGLSLLWDGASLPRLRASERHSVLRGRRLGMHILIQPRTAQRLFDDPELVDQELLTRILAVMPDPPPPDNLRFQCAGGLPNLDKFSERVMELLASPFEYLEPSRRRDGLSPIAMTLDGGAKRLWVAYHDDVQAQLALDGDWHPVKGLARKAPEHAARLAATISYFDDDKRLAVTADYMKAGITLADFYLAEAVRIREGMSTNEDLMLAANLLQWLHEVWKEPHNLVSLPDIYQSGPYAIRDKETAQRIVAILEDHGWLQRRDPCQVNGNARRKVWAIIREDPK